MTIVSNQPGPHWLSSVVGLFPKPRLCVLFRPLRQVTKPNYPLIAIAESLQLNKGLPNMLARSCLRTARGLVRARNGAAFIAKVRSSLSGPAGPGPRLLTTSNAIPIGSGDVLLKLLDRANHFNIQRAASSSSSPSQQAPTLRPNLAAILSTSLAVGSIAWYYHLYGPTAHAMTPAEEG